MQQGSEGKNSCLKSRVDYGALSQEIGVFSSRHSADTGYYLSVTASETILLKVASSETRKPE